MNGTLVGRREFVRLVTGAGGGLALALAVPFRSNAALPRPSTQAFTPNAWVRIGSDDIVTVVLSKSEMGQGIATGLPTILADELDASMNRIEIEFAPADARFDDSFFKSMVTGGSTSIANSWLPLRHAGASARAMLVTAAAERWGVSASSCTARESIVYHEPSKRSATFGSLAEAASRVPLPRDVRLKEAGRFALIGRNHQRLDVPHKVNGATRYGIDIRLPGMVYAAIARSPVFGGTVRSFDGTKAKALPGVLHVVAVSNGVAVVAKNTYAAFSGKLALIIDWNEGPNARTSTASLFREAEELAKNHTGERVAISRGTQDGHAGSVLEAIYRGPFLAHATMEPQNTTAEVRDGRCEVWSPTQVQTRALAAASKASGLPPESCTIHTTFLGGGFGRRLEADYVSEAVEVAKAVNLPVKVMWTREDDTQHDFYRAMSVNVVRGVVSQGELTSLSHQVVSKSWLRRWAPPFVKNGIDYLDLEEVYDAPYAIPNLRVSYIEHDHGIPVGSWRAPNANWNAFVTESFMDELAHAAGKDPLEFRLSLLKHNARARRVLLLAAEKSNWGQKRSSIAQGLAVVFWAGSYGAMVADVAVKDGRPAVQRVYAAVDCGIVVNPDIVKQQAQSATNFGLSAALTGKITIKAGRVEQSNFYDYTVLRGADAPPVHVQIVPSHEAPTGIGELCTPPIAPAVGNALYALTGKRIRSLPLGDARLG